MFTGRMTESGKWVSGRAVKSPSGDLFHIYFVSKFPKGLVFFGAAVGMYETERYGKECMNFSI